MGNVMAPVPYDVPRLPRDVAGVEAAGEALAAFYRACGVLGGGGGELFGLRIDHVLHAMAGTPTMHGASSPSRTVATMGEPCARAPRHNSHPACGSVPHAGSHPRACRRRRLLAG